MLYNPMWEVKVDPLTLDGLIAWLEKQPAETAYDYVNAHDCLLCRYFRASGIGFFGVALNSIYHDKNLRNRTTFPDVLRAVSCGDDDTLTWTYGAALDRARKTQRT